MAAAAGSVVATISLMGTSLGGKAPARYSRGALWTWNRHMWSKETRWCVGSGGVLVFLWQTEGLTNCTATTFL